MKKFLLVLGLMSLLLAVGCGGGSDNAEQQAQGEIQKAKDEVQVATHDCDGGCGMKDVPVDKLTEIDGKFYCAGCAKHAAEGDHSGHNHN